MVCCCDDGDEYEQRVSDAENDKECYPDQPFTGFAFLKGFPENAGMVNHGTADDKRVTKMHAGHRSQGVNVITAHPNAVCVVVSDRVEEAILRWEEPRGHAGVQDKCYESKEIRKG